MAHDWIRFPQCPMLSEEWYWHPLKVDEAGNVLEKEKRWRQRIPSPCTHERCQFSEESEREYLERMRQLRATDETPYLRVNGGPGHPFGARS